MQKQIRIYVIYILFITYPALNLLSQNKILLGSIETDKDDNIEIYQIDIYRLDTDTTFFASYQLENSIFELTTTFPDCFRLSVSSFGCEAFFVDTCFINDKIDLQKIRLKKKEFMLSEVVVSHSRPKTKINGSLTTINVKNSILTNMGDANNVLERLPGIIKKDNQFLVLGRGASAIYIDDRLIMDNNELLLLKSQNISEISINRNPSSIYESKTKAVIQIKTIPYLKDMFDLQISNNLSFNRKINNYSDLQINFKKKKLATRFTYRYGLGGSEIKENSYQRIFHSQYTFHNDLDYTNINDIYHHNVAGMANITLDDKNRIGFQYSGLFISDKSHISKDQRFGKDDLRNNLRFIDHRSNWDSDLHTFNASYSHKKGDKTSLLLITDYAIKDNKIKNKIKEEGTTNNNISFVDYNSDSRYSIFTASLNYRFELLHTLKTVLGARYAYTENKSNTDYILQKNNSKNSLTDNLTAIFLELEKKINKITLSGGIRYEYNPVKLITQEQDSIIIQKRHLSNFLPNIKLSDQLNDNVELELNLSRKVVHPSFHAMNPIENYQDSLSVAKGSPYIKPTLIDNISLYVTLWSKLSFELGYTWNENEIVQTTILENEQSDKTMMIPINLNRTEYYNFSTSYALSRERWSANVMGMIEVPNFEMPEGNRKVKYTKPKYTFMINGSYSLSKNISLYSDFFIASPGYNSITYQHSINNFNIGILGNFFNNKLNVRIAGTDIFQGSNWNNWDEKYLNIHSGYRGTNDTRGIEISLSYRFNNIKSRIDVPRGNSDILDRVTK